MKQLLRLNFQMNLNEFDLKNSQLGNLKTDQGSLDNSNCFIITFQILEQNLMNETKLMLSSALRR